MNILYDHQIFGLQNYGGVSRYFYELSRNINKNIPKSDNVKILAPLYINNYINKKDISIDGIKIPVKNKLSKIIYFVNSLISPLDTFQTNPVPFNILFFSCIFSSVTFLKASFCCGPILS